MKNVKKWLFLLLLLNTLAIKAQVSEKRAAELNIEKLWNANLPSQKDAAIKEILSLHLSFDTLYKKLQHGKGYQPEVTRGFLEWYATADGNIQLYTLIFIPKDYIPSKKYPVRIFLHGGVTNMDPLFVNTVIDRNNPQYDTLQEIVVYPSGSYFAPWWTERQFLNVMLTLTKLKRIYNIDENSIKLGGVSDGATGTYYFANCDATTWSCLTPYIGNAGALDKLSRRQVYLNNFSCKPLFIVNTAHDPIFNSQAVLPYVHEIQKVNRNTAFYMIDTSGHNMNWFKDLSDTISHFISDHPRDPFPDSIIWQTERTDLFNRNHWVVIDKLGKSKTGGSLNDPNTVQINEASKTAYHRDTLYGIIQVYRNGNEISVQTKNVHEFTLLLSPDQFDFSQPVKVVTDEIISFDRRVEKNPEVLLRYAAEDLDRTMLFGAAIKIEVGKREKY
ncbi:MAG: hypothetical protein ABIO46_14900 [Chitinophagales bacterium]